MDDDGHDDLDYVQARDDTTDVLFPLLFCWLRCVCRWEDFERGDDQGDDDAGSDECGAGVVDYVSDDAEEEVPEEQQDAPGCGILGHFEWLYWCCSERF